MWLRRVRCRLTDSEAAAAAAQTTSSSDGAAAAGELSGSVAAGVGAVGAMGLLGAGGAVWCMDTRASPRDARVALLVRASCVVRLRSRAWKNNENNDNVA